MLGVVEKLTKLFDSNEKELKAGYKFLEQVNAWEPEISALSDDELAARTVKFREMLNYDPEKAGDPTYQYTAEELKKEREVLNEILPEAFAVVREATKRVANHRHFDVQVIAGYFLFHGKLIELFTGEGKTNAANLPLYVYALTGKGAHLVTVNDYLARLHAEWNGYILHSLGISVGAINNNEQYKFIPDEDVKDLKGAEAYELVQERQRRATEKGILKTDMLNGSNLLKVDKKEVYNCDIVYGTNNEFGFDYLRDNMAKTLAERVQKRLHYAIIDEADSVLIDEARTPLIISQNASDSNQLYVKFAAIVRDLVPEEDFTVDEKDRAVLLTEQGVSKVEKTLGVSNLYEDAQLAYHLDNALKARGLYKLDDEYIVRDGEVIIIDEFTGRAMEGRRFSEGLHQAIEAKEGVEVKKESRTLATITLQNYFRLYEHLAGMTATALTEAEEFANIYDLDVVVIPTNKPVIREDKTDMVYRTEQGKFRAIARDIIEAHKRGQPVLVGTTSIEKSERLSDMLAKEGIPHNVLNAKQHEKEAAIVREAGQKGQVTIATNMAGRGTDIALGEGVAELGGLYVIGSERHESRRIDNQLRGRSGRQGDPGLSRFYVSFEDELMRLFGGDSMANIMSKVGMSDDMPVSVKLLGKTIENAQKKVEAYNYDTRKRLVEYDDVLNQQRNIIYSLRRHILEVAKTRDDGQDLQPNEPLDAKTVQELRNQIQDMDIAHVLEHLDKFELRNDKTWEVPVLSELGIDSPNALWVLKKTVEYVRTLFANQLRDDMQVDDAEEKNVETAVKSLLGEDLAKISAGLLGYESFSDLMDAVHNFDDTVEKENLLLKLILAAYIFHAKSLREPNLTRLSKVLLLDTLDQIWMEHLDTMQDLREGINMRSFAQKDPLVEYKNEGFSLFEQMLRNVEEQVIGRFYKIRMIRQSRPPAQVTDTHPAPSTQFRRQSTEEATQDAVQKVLRVHGKENASNSTAGKQTTVRNVRKVGRNDPCPCGSGKKYKKCHGKN